MSEQLERNRAAYETLKENLERSDFGRVVLMHDGAMIAIYNDSGDAYSIGCEKYGLGNFTLHQVGQKPISLGIHTLGLNAPA